MSAHPGIDWIPVKALVQRLKAAHGASFDAVGATRGRLRSGELRARGRVVVNGQPKDDRVPESFWGVGTLIKRDDWALGDFQLAVPWNGNRFDLKQVDILGLQVSREDAEQIVSFDDADTPAQEQSSAIAPAPKFAPANVSKVAAWHTFWLVAMKMLHEGDIAAAKTLTEFRRTIHERIGGDDVLSEESVKIQARRIWMEFRSDG